MRDFYTLVAPIARLPISGAACANGPPRYPDPMPQRPRSAFAWRARAQRQKRGKAARSNRIRREIGLRLPSPLLLGTRGPT